MVCSDVLGIGASPLTLTLNCPQSQTKENSVETVDDVWYADEWAYNEAEPEPDPVVYYGRFWYTQEGASGYMVLFRSDANVKLNPEQLYEFKEVK
jgi:hypothetical protein